MFPERKVHIWPEMTFKGNDPRGILVMIKVILLSRNNSSRFQTAR